MFELFGLGRSWAGAFHTDHANDRQTAVADTPISAAGLRVNSRDTSEKAREGFRDASTALRAALGTFSRETKPVYTTTVSETRSTAALTSGKSARVGSFQVDYGVLQSANQVNSYDSGVTRQSAAAIGLDVTSAEAASRLSSSANLGLDVTGAVSTIVSKNEMNTGSTGVHNSSNLTFTSGISTSSSTGTLTGTFAGVGKAADATSLIVEIKRNATLGGGILGLGGAATVEFEVKDQTGERIFSFNGSIKAGDQVYLGADIGLSLSFSAGDLTKNHTSSTTISWTPITVDANATFNDANASLRPKFTNNAQVTAGSFTVNGTAIAVNANDSVNSVISRINGSGAGVTASLSGDKITLVTNSNSDQNILLANDSSNFLKATQLDGASTVKGDLRDDERLLSDTGKFGNITSGSFQINGVAIAVDKNTDTLKTVLAKINASGAGVTASFDSSTNLVKLVSSSNSEDLITVANDTTKFLVDAKLSSNNTVRGNIRDDQQILSKTTQFASVTTGSFTVNGVSIAVNKDSDTIASIIGKVNGAGAGVTASYDAATDKLLFTRQGSSLTLAGDTSGFLAAAQVATGTTNAIHEANPDAAFNGTGANAPMFETGSVQAGAFSVNGVTINVAANDSINSVLAKITASAAGVTATYDSRTELVTLNSNEGGTGPITVGGDTSGFLAAVKLDSGVASVSTRTYSSFTSALDEIPEYAGVTAGTLTVNGQDIAIDPATTTIDGLVTALNGLTGVAAQLNETNGAIDIWSETTGASFAVADTSGLFDALGIDAGAYTGTVGRSSSVTTRTGTSTTSNSIDVATKVSAAVTRLNDVFAELGADGVTGALEGVIDSLRDKGIRGLTVTSDGAGVTVSVARGELVNALNALGEDVDLATALDTLMDDFAADVAAAAGWDAPEPASQTVRLADTSRAQLAADQTATSLLFLRSSLQPQESEEATQKAALKAYSAKS